MMSMASGFSAMIAAIMATNSAKRMGRCAGEEVTGASALMSVTKKAFPEDGSHLIADVALHKAGLGMAASRETAQWRYQPAMCSGNRRFGPMPDFGAPPAPGEADGLQQNGLAGIRE